jgi:hypothetical protein
MINMIRRRSEGYVVIALVFVIRVVAKGFMPWPRIQVTLSTLQKIQSQATYRRASVADGWWAVCYVGCC